MRILVSGSTGMIGSSIVAALRARGDEVAAMRRGVADAEGLDVAWDPAAGTIDVAALTASKFDVIVHLAGESLLGRWTPEHKARIRDSRVDGTALLARTLAKLEPEQRPEALLVASASGWYGDRGEELLTEDSGRGAGFLAGVVDEWEDAADPARTAGIRTVHLRMAPVQGRAGGALKAQLLPFRLGVGGRVGSGRQWSPWIGLTEATAMWLFAIDTQTVEGAVNAVGPTPCRNSEYVRALGRAVHRPTVIPAPIPLMKLALGSELIDEMLLTSQKLVPARLEALGYQFIDRTIDIALKRELAQ